MSEVFLLGAILILLFGPSVFGAVCWWMEAKHIERMAEIAKMGAAGPSVPPPPKQHRE